MSEHMSEEKDSHSETLRESLENILLGIAYELGMAETEEMSRIRDSISPEAMDSETLGEMIGKYNTLATMGHAPKATREGNRRQTGILLATAAIIHKCGLHDDVAEYLDEAIYHAEQTGDEDTASIIEKLFANTQNKF